MIDFLTRLSPLFTKTAAYSVIRLVSLVVQFVTSIVVARLLGAEMFGAYTYAFVIATIFGAFLTLGLEQLTVRELPHALERGRFNLARGFLVTTWLTFCVVAGLVTLMFWSLERWGVMSLAPGWFLVSLLAITHGMSLTLASLLVGFHRITTAQFLESIPRGILLLAVIGAIAATGAGLDPARLFLIVVLTSVPALVAMILVAARAATTTIPATERPEYRLRYWYVAAVPIAVSGLAQLIKDNTDIIMVGIMLGDFETGIYRAAARGAFLVSFAGLISIRVLGPMLSKAVAGERRDEAQNLLANAALLSVAIGMPVCLVLGLGASLYLGLFGEGFPLATDALKILLIGRAAEILTAAVPLVLVLYRHEWIVFYANLVGLTLNVVLNFYLVQIWGIEGVAIATAFTTIAVNGALLVIVLRRVGLDPTIVAGIRKLRKRFLGRA